MTGKDETKVKEIIEAAMKEQHDATCPNCGYCPTCGRQWARPYQPWPVYPQPPWQPGPIWYSNTAGTTIDNATTFTIDYSASS